MQNMLFMARINRAEVNRNKYDSPHYSPSYHQLYVSSTDTFLQTSTAEIAHVWQVLIIHINFTHYKYGHYLFILNFKFIYLQITGFAWQTAEMGLS